MEIDPGLSEDATSQSHVDTQGLDKLLGSEVIEHNPNGLRPEPDKQYAAVLQSLQEAHDRYLQFEAAEVAARKKLGLAQQALKAAQEEVTQATHHLTATSEQLETQKARLAGSMRAVEDYERLKEQMPGTPQPE